MNIILLSGGSGQRLWPLSNNVRSKQFIKLFKNSNGEYESMMQRVVRQIREVDPDAALTIATSHDQVSSILSQVGEDASISVEPSRRDTYPAILLAASYLYDACGVSRDEAVVVCPVDSYVDTGFFKSISRLSEYASKGESKLVLMGIKPTFPTSKYGYIVPEDNKDISRVKQFVEKPGEKKAAMLIEEGALWNGGLFAFKLGYVLDMLENEIGVTDYAGVSGKYEELRKISFDYAVAEVEESRAVMSYDGEWKDLGTWNTLTDEMDDNLIGKGIMDDSCKNLHIINELNVPILAMGIKNAVITAGPQGILVSDKNRSAQIKQFVDRLGTEVMIAEKTWGQFQVLDVAEDSMTVKITVFAGKHIDYQSHDHRDVVWTVIRGTGRTVVDGMEQKVTVGDVITMQAGCKHTVIADTEMNLIEIQLGREISANDQRKYKYNFD